MSRSRMPWLADAELQRAATHKWQSLGDEPSYSCGIVYLPPGGRRLTLARYNGPNHLPGWLR